MTVLVTNIHPRATEDNIKSHFGALLKGSKPLVGPIVPYIKKKEVKGRARPVRRLATTVTFQGKDDKDCEFSREFLLHGSELVLKCTERGEIGTDIAVQKEFLGLSPLQHHYEHKFKYDNSSVKSPGGRDSN
jgi:hypothetical protein